MKIYVIAKFMQHAMLTASDIERQLHLLKLHQREKILAKILHFVFHILRLPNFYDFHFRRVFFFFVRHWWECSSVNTSVVFSRFGAHDDAIEITFDDTQLSNTVNLFTFLW